MFVGRVKGAAKFFFLKRNAVVELAYGMLRLAKKKRNFRKFTF